jgi:trigger factor
MRVSVETTSGLERRLTVGVPADRVDTAVDKRLQEAARNVRLPGFRPGKVPDAGDAAAIWCRCQARGAG